MYLSAGRAADAARGISAHDRGPRRAAVPGTVLALGMVSLVTDVSAEMVTAVLPLYLVAGLGMTPLAFGALEGFHQGAGALLRLVGGRVADRTRRRKRVAGTGYALSAVCKALLPVAATPWAVAGVLAADRAGKGLRTAPRDALISLSVPPAAQGRAFGVHRAMDTTGALLGPLAAFGVLWFVADGYDAVFTLSFCCAALGVVLLALFVREAPAPDLPEGPVAPGPGGRADRVPVLRTLLGVPGLLRLCAAAAGLGVFTVGDAFLYLLLQRRLDLSAAQFPLLAVGTSAVFLLCAVPVGRLADRVGRSRMFLAGHVLPAAVCLLLALPGPAGGGLLLLAVPVLLGVFYAATDGVLMAAAGPLLPEPLRTTGLAAVQTAQALGRFAGAVLFGAAWTAWGPGPALVVAAAGLLAGTAGAAVLRGKSGRKRTIHSIRTTRTSRTTRT
ncbi:MFS transporter [Streptomyces antimicrobicus]|uniref:MFS transporter n=1 Tax=Streptomyces antimicrobicus TaxID=2883108 RepID=A0ABS8BD02_9ACTN|nr:MFS transporter [Streptomyces antimicrobicus]MCB5182403.1 MFS transporter [Streptomyces antimicrobicus]